KRACDFLGLDYQQTKIITVHLGNGASATAVKNGKSIDTSMGLTPLEGLMMGTRSGDVDLGIATFLMEKEMIGPSVLSTLFNKHSGMLGVSGISSDMRDIKAAIEKGNERARLALEMYEYRIIKYIGAYTAALNGVDLLAFTGGVGENQASTRTNVCNNLNYLGVKIDEKINMATQGKEALISTPDSSIKVAVIPTDEEFMIASDTYEIVKGL
ncbi:MAG TPA: acetate kinase, partial [Paludibacteraceae bacterium]|nr:acetate kinase [Paludibacteraceae bacterium]